MIWGVGQLESEMTFSPAQAVIDDETIAYVQRYLRGVDVGADALAVEVTRSVGIGGEYLSHEHTLEHYRNELFEPAVLCRVKRDAWNAAGGKRLGEAAEDAADALIDAERPPYITEDQGRQLRAIEESLTRSL